MEDRYLKTGQAVDRAIDYYGYTTGELAEIVYGGRNPDCVNKLRKRLKKWLYEALRDLPYDSEESVWDHYAKDKNKENSDRLLPEFVVQRWYMEIHRERFREFFSKLEEQPVALEKTTQAFIREKDRLEEAEEEALFENRPYSSDIDYAEEFRHTSKDAAKKEIVKQKLQILWEYYMESIGKTFSDRQEHNFVKDWYKRDMLINAGDYGIIFQELDAKLKDIQNYFE